MVERKKDEKMRPETGMNGTSDAEMRKASGGSNLNQPDRPGTYGEADRDKQISEKGSESQATGSRGETGSEKDFRGEENSGIKKDVDKDWKSGEQKTGSSSNSQMRNDETSSSEKDVDEEKKSSEKEEPRRKSQD
jgi:hypothetical protein